MPTGCSRTFLFRLKSIAENCSFASLKIHSTLIRTDYIALLDADWAGEMLEP